MDVPHFLNFSFILFCYKINLEGNHNENAVSEHKLMIFYQFMGAESLDRALTRGHALVKIQHINCSLELKIDILMCVCHSKPRNTKWSGTLLVVSTYNGTNKTHHIFMVIFRSQATHTHTHVC